MAPSRRKAVNKAAAAAARRKWKVGDLVLAKVKGYPAWPAEVSEPEKWGYPADWKKVVVHFFASRQIAFCSPADVEEFTEEKKLSLLGKRHGSEFLRALNEIIDRFEKLRKQDQVSGVNGTEEASSNRNASEESLSKCIKDVAPEVAFRYPSTGTANDLNSLTEAAVEAAAEDALHDEEMQLVEADVDIMHTETPTSTTYTTRSKTDVAGNTGLQKRKSARTLRSSSRINANKLQNFILPSTNHSRSSRRLGGKAFQDRSLRRSKRFMKSSDDSEERDGESPVSISNRSSIGESDSEIMTVDEDALSLDDNSTVNSTCKPLSVEPPNENNEAETELCDRLDFQTKTAVVKKKRMHNRKRLTNDSVVESTLDVASSDAEVLKTELVSPINNGKLARRSAKDDGDEHLPLVKRARVRMGRPSPSGEEEIPLLHKEEEIPLLHKEEEIIEFAENLAKSSPEPLSSKVEAPANGKSIPNEGDHAKSSLSCVSPKKKPQFWETRKNFMDGEAALPPSKRLHRALEAMSANVAEDCGRASHYSPAADAQSNESCPTILKCSDLSIENESASEFGPGPHQGHRNGDTLLGTSEFCAVSTIMPKHDGKAVVMISNCDKTSCKVDSTNPDFLKDSFEHERADGTRLNMTSSDAVPGNIDAECNVKPDPINTDEQLTPLDCNTPGLKIAPTDQTKLEHSELNDAGMRSIHDNSRMPSDYLLLEESAQHYNSCNLDTRKHANCEGGVNKTDKMNHVGSFENQDIKRSEVVEETRPASRDSKVLLSFSDVKVLSNGHHQYQSHSNSISCDHVEDKTLSVTRSSSCQTDGTDCVARASPPCSSMYDMSAVDNNNNSLEKNISCSPDVQLHLEKAKLAGKPNSKMESLSSFEDVIRSLTRTKESIGRATRIAINCAKSGFATKVVEILARNLESESRSHRKVDLFFLVDSITQCSRGIKGDAGIYPSAIQALLPRLLLAAAPPGSNSHDNHRQCLKVLRVWQERKVLPEPIIRHHIRELDALCGSYPSAGSRRPLRNERAFDDPVREMEGMLVDEYGSNSSIQLLGFCMPPMLRDDDRGSDSDGESFEAVTPEHNSENLNEGITPIPAVEKRSHILEDVDGELEMEDVAPCCEIEIASTSDTAEHTQMSHQQTDSHNRAPCAPQQSKDVPLASAPLPRSSHPLPPPPPPHPPQPSVFLPAVLNSVSNGHDPKLDNFNSKMQESRGKQPVVMRSRPTNLEAVHRRSHYNKDLQSHVPRQVPQPSNACSSRNQPAAHLPGRASNSVPPADALSKGFHLRPPHPAPSNQFSYVQEQRIQSRKDIPPPSHPNRFHMRHSENGNFYRDRDRNKFPPHDNIGECWRPPCPSISGPCYRNGARMDHPPTSYDVPLREPPFANNRWNFPPQPMNQRHYNSYRSPANGPVPVANRGPNFWRPR